MAARGHRVSGMRNVRGLGLNLACERIAGVDELVLV